MSRQTRIASVFLGVVVVLLWTISCASAPRQRSTSLAISDFQMMMTNATLGLLQSDLIVSRSPDDPPMRIAFDKVTNLTTDLLTPSAQWLIVEQAVRSQEVNELKRLHNVSFIIPAERFSERSQGEGRTTEGVRVAGAYTEREPTHRLEATVRSVTRIVDSERSELYESVMLLTNLASGEQSTLSSTLVKRAARGRLWD